MHVTAGKSVTIRDILRYIGDIPTLQAKVNFLMTNSPEGETAVLNTRCPVILKKNGEDKTNLSLNFIVKTYLILILVF